MPVITQGQRQFIVSIDTLLGWKRFRHEHPDAKIRIQSAVNGTLFVTNGGGEYTIDGRRVTPA